MRSRFIAFMIPANLAWFLFRRVFMSARCESRRTSRDPHSSASSLNIQNLRVDEPRPPTCFPVSLVTERGLLKNGIALTSSYDIT
jgi:hypothetical protein